MANKAYIKMKTTVKSLFFLALAVAIIVLLWNSILKSHGKSRCISHPCEASFSEERDEETVQNQSWRGMQIQTTVSKRAVREFVYMIQTKKCLPPKLLSEQRIGDGETCRCDVLVLSFKTPCEGKNRSSFPHVEYLSRPADVDRISWNSGRNLLYSTIKARNYEYLYYIFMDDDLEFKYNARTPSSVRSLFPMRSFENFLLEFKPAIGVPNYVADHNADIMIQKMKNICKKRFNPSSVYVPVIHFDAAMNAFHKDVVDHILPYPTKFDKINWTHSQRYVIVATEVKFRGQCYLYIPVDTFNTYHADYPRIYVNASQVWSSIVQDLISTIPSKYANQSWIKEYVEDPMKHNENSHAICWEFPLGFPIKPFAYYNLYQN